jgi:lipopolysaccharide export system protein LptA
MKNPNTDSFRSFLIPVICLLLLPLSALAEKADRDKPVNLEADTVTVDDAKRISTYEGNVVLVQGTLNIRSDKMVVTEDAEGFQHGTAYGNPAYFRQKREGFDEYIEGWGKRIEYDNRTDKVELFTEARMRKNQDEVHGNFISYDGKTELFNVIGGGKEAASASNPRGRVRAVMQPKKKTGEAAPPPAGQPLPLKPSDSVANPRQ